MTNPSTPATEASTHSAADLPRWDAAPLGELIRLIVARYHDSLRSELPALVDLAARVERQHAERADCPRGLHALLEVLHQRIVDHLEKEERVLFPMILDRIGAGVGGPVRVLEEEHIEHVRDLRRIRQFTHNYTPPVDACTSWQALYVRLAALEQDFRDHVHLENTVLFVRALTGSEV